MSPKANRIPTARSPQFAAPKPAADVIVCTRFCLSRLRNFSIDASGIRAIAIASSAPITDVFGVMPILAMICMQITADRTETKTLTSSVSLSSAFTCGSCVSFM